LGIDEFEIVPEEFEDKLSANAIVTMGLLEDVLLIGCHAAFA
jgi:hypothetical protein